MYGRRIFPNILTNKSNWKPCFLKTSSSRFLFSPFSSTTPSALVNSIPVTVTDINLIKKRFYHGGSNRRFATRSRKLSSKLFTVFGLLLGIGSGGAAYHHSLVDKDSSIHPFLVSCEDKACNKEKEKEKDEEKDCVKKEKDEEKEKDKEKDCVKKDNSKDCIPKRCHDSHCLHKMDCEEDLIRRANADLERAIKDTKGKALEYTEKAMKAFCEAIKVMRDFLDHTYCVLDNDELECAEYEEAWCCLHKIAKKRCVKVKEAITRGQCAWELLCRLREVVDSGKECKYTACHPILVTAEETLICAEKELLNMKARMDCVASEHEMVAQYRDVIETFKADLQSDVEKEIASLECCDILYVEQEMAIMIQEAYLQVIRAQKELAKVLICQNRVPERYKCTCC